MARKRYCERTNGLNSRRTGSVHCGVRVEVDRGQVAQLVHGHRARLDHGWPGHRLALVGHGHDRVGVLLAGGDLDHGLALQKTV